MERMLSQYFWPRLPSVFVALRQQQLSSAHSTRVRILSSERNFSNWYDYQITTRQHLSKHCDQGFAFVIQCNFIAKLEVKLCYVMITNLVHVSQVSPFAFSRAFAPGQKIKSWKILAAPHIETELKVDIILDSNIIFD